MKSFIAAIASISLISSPALAEAVPTAAVHAHSVLPAMEQVDGLQAMPSYAWWIVGGLLFGGLILLLVLDGDDDDVPASP